MGRVHLGQESLFLNSRSKAISSRNKRVGHVDQYFDRAVKKKIAQPESSSYFPSVAALSDGTIVSAFGFGGVRMADGTTTSAIVRISPDMSFSDVTVNDLNGYAGIVSVDSQDRFVVSGMSPALSRYSASGTYDSSFANEAEAIDTGGIQSFDLDSSDRILIASFQNMSTGTPAQTFQRIDSDGSVDSSFLNRLQYDPFAAQNECWHVSVSPIDDSVIVAGTFVSVDNTSVNNGIARFHANGVFDSSFSPFLFDDGSYIYSTRTDPATGKVYIAGSFTSVGAAVDRYYLARLHPNGAVDNSFVDVGLSDGAYIRHIEPLSNGGVVIAGNFEIAGNNITSVPVEERRSDIARLNQDGLVEDFDLKIPNDNFYTQSTVIREFFPTAQGQYLISGSSLVEVDGTSTPLGFAKIQNKNLP